MCLKKSQKDALVMHDMSMDMSMDMGMDMGNSEQQNQGPGLQRPHLAQDSHHSSSSERRKMGT